MQQMRSQMLLAKHARGCLMQQLLRKTKQSRQQLLHSRKRMRLQQHLVGWPTGCSRQCRMQLASWLAMQGMQQTPVSQQLSKLQT
jgi:hypothetical protein